MKYKLVNKEIRSNYAKELFQERGIEDIQSFLHPTDENLQDFNALDNIDEGISLISATLSDEHPYAMIADSD